MRARLHESLHGEPFARDAADIVRSCVHCGFCNATCPTYQLSGDELEGPRGRIYLIKSLLESGEAGTATREHLDHCLLCRNCETTCPSGVNYGRLVELARPRVRAMQPDTASRRLVAWALAKVAVRPALFAPAIACARALRNLLPMSLREHVPRRVAAGSWPAPRHPRRVLMLGGCVQPVLRPSIDAAAARVADRLGISLVAVPASGCCGALPGHLGYTADARRRARDNIDAWWPHVEAGAEAVMATSSACGLELSDYPHLLADDPDYAERAARVADLARDPLDLFGADALASHLPASRDQLLAVHAPCTLQHGQRRLGALEALFGELGYTLAPVQDAHLCCGAAGSYALMHPSWSHALRRHKLDNLLSADPVRVVTANIGCQLHLDSAAPVPVQHWLEFIDEELARAASAAR